MTLTRFDPTRSLDPLSRSWNEMMSQFFGGGLSDDDVVQRVWVPRVDIVEGSEAYRVHADLPGLVKEDVNITLEDGVLTISGERRNDFTGDEVCHLNERAQGRFSRSFTLRNTVDIDKIDASFKDGVLTVTLPKVESAKPRKIEIKAH